VLGDHLGDPGPVQREALGGEPGGDLIDGVPVGTEFDDPAPGGVLTGALLGPGVAVRKNSWAPPRKSRTAEFSAAVV